MSRHHPKILIVFVIDQYNETAIEVSRYFNRDLSWLAFNQRVLEECLDPVVPLAEKIKFIAIHASNLDEFYRVRVSHLETLEKMGDYNTEENASYRDILASVRRKGTDQANYLRTILTEKIIPELEKNNIVLYRNGEECTRSILTLSTSISMPRCFLFCNRFGSNQ